MRIVFFGTPEFAVPSLRALVGEGFEVVAVVTQPDRPRGRSRSRPEPPPVKTAALAEGIPVLQPERPNASEFLQQLAPLEPDLGVVVAYGHILRKELLELPRLGMINLHASLLPKLRGAAPIQHAIIEGYTETGVSVMQMDEGMDTGPVLLRIPTPIAPDETGGELSGRLAELGALALVEVLTLLAGGAVRPEPQDEREATYAPKITRETARIKWTDPAERIARLARALDPEPGAWTRLGLKEVKLFLPQVLDSWGAERPPLPGTVLATDPALVVTTDSGALRFMECQPAGKNRMATVAWARGRGVKVGDRFE
jgi:methionyl-tRNA formyltransferase